MFEPFRFIGSIIQLIGPVSCGQVCTVFIPINSAAFIFFESVVGGGVYWRVASIGGRRLIVQNDWLVYYV